MPAPLPACIARPRWDFQTQFGEQSAYLRIDESLHDRAVELSDDVVARTFGSPQALPQRRGEPGYPSLFNDRTVGGRNPARLAHPPIFFDLPTAHPRQRPRSLAPKETASPAPKTLICGAA